MPIDFPNSPITNDTYTTGGRTWVYDGEKWNLATTISGYPLDTLSDVTITSPATGQALIYDGTEWNNEVISTDPMADSKFTPIITMDVGV